MARTKPKLRPADTVLLLSINHETRDSLGAYFAQTDVVLQMRSTLDPAALVPTIGAVVLFPDDFGDREVASYLSLVRSQRPDLSVLVVTRSPSKYRAVTDTEQRRLHVIVVPRPAFGWNLLDLVRDVLAQR